MTLQPGRENVILRYIFEVIRKASTAGDYNQGDWCFTLRRIIFARVLCLISHTQV
jgi:hypothetical protein